MLLGSTVTLTITYFLLNEMQPPASKQSRKADGCSGSYTSRVAGSAACRSHACW